MPASRLGTRGGAIGDSSDGFASFKRQDTYDQLFSMLPPPLTDLPFKNTMSEPTSIPTNNKTQLRVAL